MHLNFSIFRFLNSHLCKIHIYHSWASLSSVIFILVITSSCSFFNPAYVIPKAESGKLNIQNWNFQDQGNIKLSGEWEFYPDNFLQPEEFATTNFAPKTIIVPSAWNGAFPNSSVKNGKGIGTYRLIVQSNQFPTQMGIKMMTVGTAMDMFVNNNLVYQQGKVGNSADDMIPRYEPGVAIFKPQGNKIEIVIHVSNFFYRSGGLWDNIHLGSEEDIHTEWANSIALELFIIGCLFVICTYNILSFNFQKNYCALYFSIFCFLIMLRILTTGECLAYRITPISWFGLIKIEYISFYGGTLAFIVFFRSIFFSVFPQKVFYAFLIPYIIAVLLVIFTPPSFFTHTVLPVQIITVFFAAYLTYLLFKAIGKKIPGSISFSIGFVAIYLTIINDTLFANEIIATGFYSSVGILLFTFTQEWSLAKRFSDNFHQIQKMNGVLRKQNYQIEKQNDELKNLNHELDIFVYRTSHDLRAPIASVLGLINLSRVEPNQSQKVIYLDMKEKVLKKLDNFINEILFYSRNSRTEIAREEIDFRLLVEETLEMLTHYEKFEEIAINIDIDQKETFISDKNRLTVIFNNLISNAIRYSNPYISNAFLNIKIKTDSRKVYMEFADNGIGIDDKYINQIFDMFFRTNEKSGGSGLGLFLVKDTLTKLGGNINVRSTINQGTTFSLTIPNLKTEPVVPQASTDLSG